MGRWISMRCDVDLRVFAQRRVTVLESLSVDEAI